MKIVWKTLSQTKGYKSLKAAYIHDVKKEWRSKTELLRKFYWVINRAKHYSKHTGKSVESILNYWESKRNYGWLNYYQNCNQPKFHSNAKKPSGIKGIRKYYKKNNWMSGMIKHRICKFIQEKQETFAKKRADEENKKRRWTMDYKKSKYR